MIKLESKFITAFQKWLKYNWKWPESFVWEVKVVRTKNFRYADFPEHQRKALSIAKHESFIYKISDLDRTQKPCDGIYLRQVGAYLVLHWIRRGNKIFYMVDIDIIMAEIKNGNKSVSEETISEIAEIKGGLA